MKNTFMADLLLQIEEAMLANIQKKESGPPMQEAIEAIIATDEYLFLRFYDSVIDTDEYIINFIRFVGIYTANPEKVAKMFAMFVDNVQQTHRLFLNPAVQFMADPSKHNLLMGFFTAGGNHGSPD